ncbi:MAG: topoisomerase protein, partial [Candidatus Woesebacteria bacterium GW2011_GWB1_38_8]
KIDQKLVDAQQARRVLDRLVGYLISPVLWKRYWRGLSAGRVQSVVVRLIVDREREIEAFNPQEYWSISAIFEKFATDLVARDGKEIEKQSITTAKEAEEIIADLKGAEYKVSSVSREETSRTPHAPFTTATLQQVASKRLHYSSKQTMMFAQQLYEAGRITYMRTDSVNLSEQSLAQVGSFIKSEFGEKYYHHRKFKTKSKSAQEAHEAIRPTNPKNTPEAMASSLSSQQAKLYELIWRRFVASQMTDAKFDATAIDIKASKYGFRATGSVLTFDGWLKVFPSAFEDVRLPLVKGGQILELQELKSEQHFTKPPARFNEASLIKILEKEGIGRPSTYAAIISTVQTRGYVEKDRSRAFHPTDTGRTVHDFMMANFPRIVDIQFTAKMEDELDEIARGEREWIPTIREFYTPLAVEVAEKSVDALAKKESEEEKTDKICDLCGAPMIVKRGRFGKFIACSKFPECKNILKEKKDKEPPKLIGRSCPQDAGDLVERHGRFGIFIACSNFPKCKYTEKIKKAEEVAAEPTEEEKPLAENLSGDTIKGI